MFAIQIPTEFVIQKPTIFFNVFTDHERCLPREAHCRLCPVVRRWEERRHSRGPRSMQRLEPQPNQRRYHRRYGTQGILSTSSLISPSFQDDPTTFHKGLFFQQTPCIKN